MNEMNLENLGEGVFNNCLHPHQVFVTLASSLTKTIFSPESGEVN
jgi:hypothetical protein